MSEQVKGIPQDLRELYEFLTQDYFVKQGIGHAEMEIKPILAIIERIARSEQALAALETQWWIRLGKFRMALDAANLHGHYNLLQEHFEDEAGKWEELLTQLNASQQQVAALEARNKELESPVSFSEAEAVLDLPMNMEKFIEHVDFANKVLTRRITINRERAALKGAS